jgi:hypothetical protein
LRSNYAISRLLNIPHFPPTSRECIMVRDHCIAPVTFHRGITMSYNVTTYDDGQILVLTLNADFDIANEMVPSFEECFKHLESGTTDVVFISDARDLPIRNLNDLIQGSSFINKPEAVRVNKHTRVIKTYTISNSSVIQLAAKGLNSASFGNLVLGVFTSLEEGLNQARLLLHGQSRTA